MNTTSSKNHQTRILPALHEIQDKHGYLVRSELERFSKEAEIPLYKLQAVASFFPHFHLTPPPAVTLSVCRDMSCHLAGSSAIRAELKKLEKDGFRVKGVSCLGRCDRTSRVHQSSIRSD